jgi:hypothetical protein
MDKSRIQVIVSTEPFGTAIVVEYAVKWSETKFSILYMAWAPDPLRGSKILYLLPCSYAWAAGKD